MELNLKLEIGKKYRTKTDWAAKYGGKVLTGTLERINDEGTSIHNPYRTHVLRMDTGFFGLNHLTFDPADLEEISE